MPTLEKSSYPAASLASMAIFSPKRAFDQIPGNLDLVIFSITYFWIIDISNFLFICLFKSLTNCLKHKILWKLKTKKHGRIVETEIHTCRNNVGMYACTCVSRYYHHWHHDHYPSSLPFCHHLTGLSITNCSP